jgi:hypothetical protein
MIERASSYKKERGKHGEFMVCERKGINVFSPRNVEDISHCVFTSALHSLETTTQLASIGIITPAADVPRPPAAE